MSNKTHPRHPGVVKICASCNGKFKSRKKYCSRKCKYLGSLIPRKILIDYIKEFFKDNKRIPCKRELGHYSAIRREFGTWNKAIKKAGFVPNPVKFAKKHTANDGHICDSVAEKIIDDWLFARGIKHKRSVPYPDNERLTCDFVIGDKWIEFFGLYGEHKRYDELRSEKLKIVKKKRLKFLDLYPEDIIPKNNLSKLFN